MDINREEARTCLNLAIAAFNQRQLDKALKCIKKAEQLYPTCETKVVKNIILAHLKSTQKAHARNTPNGYNQARRGSRPETKYAAPEYTAEQLEAVRRIRSCRNHYDILMVTKDANICDIKKAYKKLALILHPDKNKAPCADEAFKTLVNAFKVLSDPDQRMLYDFRTFRSNPTNVKNTADEQQPQYPRGQHERQYNQRCFCDCCCCINPHLRCKQCRCCYRHYMSQATPNGRPKNRARPNPFYNI